MDAGKIKPSDERTAHLLAWTPWLSFVLSTLPLPMVFLVLFGAVILLKRRLARSRPLRKAYNGIFRMF